MSQTKIDLREKTVDELKVLAWDLRTAVETYNGGLQAVLQELNQRQVAESEVVQKEASQEKTPKKALVAEADPI